MKKLVISSLIMGLSGFLLVSFTPVEKRSILGDIPIPFSIGGDKKKDKKKHKHHDNGHHHGKKKGNSIQLNIDLGKDGKSGLRIKDKHGRKGKHGNHGHDNVVIVFDHPTGHQRADKARKKHKKYKPKKEKETHDHIKIIIVRNDFLYIETGDKISLAKKRNHEKYKGGMISRKNYDDNVLFIGLCEKRRASIKIKMKV